MINLQLERIFLADTYTIGKLSINGIFFSDTLEDKTRDLNKDGDLDDLGEGKVYGETSIPYGRYKVILSYSPKFKRILPEILNVKGFTAIRIHAGNTPKDTLGCILVGENKVKGGLINSRLTESALIQKLQLLNDEIYINIV